MRGRILYDFSGSACEGYALQFRQVSEIDAGEGAMMTTDLRATTWEDAAAKTFRFNSQNYVDQKLKTTVDGRAERAGPRVGVNLNKPAAKKFGLDQTGIFFPTDHMRRIIVAARGGTDASGRAGFRRFGQRRQDLRHADRDRCADRAAMTKKPDDAAAKDEVAVEHARWPVSISYFERTNDKPNKPGEQTADLFDPFRIV